MVGERRVALITGASGGVGGAVAAELARKGYALSLLYRSNTAACEAAAGSAQQAGADTLLLRTDLTDHDSVEAAVTKTVEHFGAIDVLAHCAGAY